MRKFQVLERNHKTATGEMIEGQDGLAFVVKVFGDTNDLRKDDSSQTTVECSRRHK